MPGLDTAANQICLSMIVKNEARVLRRCLDTCRPWIDALCICDTGSSDGTPEVALRFAAEHAIPVEVARHAWTDFGANRTLALEAAKAFTARLGWKVERTYLLLLDADQVVESAAPLAREALHAEVYLLEQTSGDEVYWNTRLVRADCALGYQGVTHEYLVVPDGAPRERLAGVRVRDGNDGGSRADKFERDRRLLEAALAADPRNPRTLFYLARTYRALGERLKALSLFRRRIEAGGWSEEVWHAWFASAEIQREGGDEREARAALLEALRVLPARAEALHLLATLHRAAGRSARAAAAARCGLKRPFPAEASLFVDRRPYAYGLREELALSGAGTRHHAAGFDALDGLLADRSVPAAVKERTQEALLRYVEPWPAAVYVPLTPALPAPYVPCNPSVLREGDGYLVCCRAVNYRQQDARDYSFPDGERVVRTQNLLLRLGPHLEPRAVLELHGAPPPLRDGHIVGFEDLRLAATSDGLVGLATTADRHPSGLVGPSLLRLAPDGQVLHHVPLTGYGLERAEKNWLPFAGPHGELRVLYGLAPWVVLACDVPSGRCQAVERHDTSWDLSRWRNSAGPLPLTLGREQGSLILTHEVVFLPERRRRYLHRFAWRSCDGDRLLATRPFFFRGLGVEFAAGLCLDHEGSGLVVSLGVEDREAWLVRIPLDAVQGRLVPVAPTPVQATRAPPRPPGPWASGRRGPEITHSG